MPHYVILTPWDAPITYALWGVTWLSSLTGFLVGLSFFRRRQGTWWLLAAIVFSLPLIGEIGRPLVRGLPPLPYGEEISSELSPHDEPFVPGTNFHEFDPLRVRTTGLSDIRTTSVIHLDFTLTLMAIAFLLAYHADRKKRASAGT